MKNESLYYLAAAALCAAWLLTPAKTHAARNRNLSVNFGGSAEHCSDLKATSNGEVAQANETFTLSKSEAPILEMSGIDRGVFRVRGWDRAEYSVEACKIAAADDRAAAEQLVRGIQISRAAGRFSSTGPPDTDATWQVYFIVRAPKNASLDLETKNGPIDIADMSGGTLKVRATNGPISLHNSSGTMEIHTTNGPISFGGGGGDVHIAAQNGPISLELAGDVWNGPMLDARTVNGPVSLVLPDTFRSGVRVETSGHAPVSCGAGACKGAWTDGTSDRHVIQINGSQDTIRVSTSNGPVSVKGPRQNGRII